MDELDKILMELAGETGQAPAESEAAAEPEAKPQQTELATGEDASGLETPAPIEPGMVPPPVRKPQIGGGSDIDSVLQELAGGSSPEPEPEEPGPESDDRWAMLDKQLQELAGEVPDPNSRPADPAESEAEPHIPDPDRKKRGIFELGYDAIVRGVEQIGAGATAAGALALDDEGMMLDAQRQLSELSKPSYGSYQDITDLEDFMRWGVERAGETLPFIMATFAGGGIGGLTAGLVGKGLLTTTSRQALIRAGQLSGAFATAAPIEGGFTGAEVYQATREMRPGVALTAGAVKGLMELWMPWHLYRAFTAPAGSVVGATIKGLVGEAGTEGAQETVDLLAREWVDPDNFNFFSRESRIRVFDAMAAGGIVGAKFSAAAYGAGKGIEKYRERDQQRTLTPEELELLRQKPDLQDMDSWNNPLKWLRDKVRRSFGWGTGPIDPPPQEDFTELSTVFEGVRRTWERAGITEEMVNLVREFEDANTPRYIIQGVDGRFGKRVLTDTELETELALHPATAKPKVIKVDVRTMQAAGITADIYDMPSDATDPRFYFLPGTTQEQKAEVGAQLLNLINQADGFREALIKKQATTETIQTMRKQVESVYNDLLNNGLRVVPTMGGSFYYSGTAIGEVVEAPTTTGRSEHIRTAAINAQAPKGTFYRGGSANIKTKSQGGTVSLDWNKIKFEDGFVTPHKAWYTKSPALGWRLRDDISWYVFRKDVAEADKAQLVEEYYNKMRSYPDLVVRVAEEMHKKGVALDPRRMKELDQLEGPGTTIFHMVGKLESYMLVPGISTPELAKRSGDGVWRARGRDPQPGVAEIEIENKSIMQEDVNLARKMMSWLKAGWPDIKAFLETKLGFEPGMRVIIVQGYMDSPHYDPFRNHIKINTSHMRSSKWGQRNERLTFWNVFWHELGHMVTYGFWKKLPVDQQAKVLAGYKRALLYSRLTGRTYKTHHLFKPETGEFQPEYSLTFSEYLAEQFRRWMNTDTDARTLTEKFFKDVGQALKQMAELYQAVTGLTPAEAVDMLHPSWEFNEVMEYWESMVAQGNTPPLRAAPLRAAERATAMPENIEFPAHMQGMVEESKAALGDFTGRDPGEVSGKSLARMWAGAVETQSPTASREVTMFEFSQAAWEKMTLAEREMVLREAERLGVVPGRNWYERAAERVGKARGLSAEQIEINRIEARHVATWAEMVARHMHGQVQASTEVSSWLDRAMQLLKRIGKMLARRGYWTVDDIITAAYKGELDRRDTSRKTPETVQRDVVRLEAKLRRMGARELLLGLVKEGERASDADLVQAVTGIEPSPRMSSFEQDHVLKMQESAARNEGVPEQPETEMLRALSRRGEFNPEVNKLLKGLSSKADKISWWSKVFMGLHQIAWRNQDITHMPLQRYVRLTENMNTVRMEIISEADETARKWDRLPKVQRDKLADLLFWLTEMEYRTAQEKREKVVRQPTQLELNTRIQQLGLSGEAVQVYAEVKKRFDDYLNRVERVLIANTHRRISDLAARMAAIAEIQKDFALMRKKPYFPMTRFGKWTITVRDANTHKVKWFSAYPTALSRDNAVQEVSRMPEHFGDDIQVGIVGEEFFEFMGLPTPLLKAIRAELPGITQKQKDWLEQFEHMNAPDRSFKKHWLERKGTPGYSRDAFRVFAHYFLSGANYLSRLQFNEQLREQVNRMRQSEKSYRDSRRRVLLSDTMQEHLEYIMKSGGDWAALKAFVSLWQLGFSPAAAAMNLSQVPMVTMPHMSGIFGSGKTAKAFRQVIKSLKRSFNYTPKNSTLAFEAARQELIRQGKIDVGQAPELGAYAEGFNLVNMTAGTKAQRWYRTISWAGMALFGKAERINREVTLGMAWELALDPDLKRGTNEWVYNIEQQHASEISQLMAKSFEVNGQQVSLSYDEALALIISRTLIDQTQFIYQPWARPKFLRNPAMSVFLVFFQYMQALIYSMGNSPGRIKIILLHAAVYGMMGLPGAEDIDELVKGATRLFGKDFSPQIEARKLVKGLVQGTVLDQVGPDLVLHGVSRYSFGLALLQEGYGIPQFDASANGSLGRLVPGLAESAKILQGRDWKDVWAEVSQDAAGAGFGTLFALAQFLSNGDWSSGDLKKWERVMPRAGKALSKAWRYYSEGEERTNTGATFAQFDPADPDDLATIVAQALGFTPREVSAKWEAVIESREYVQWLQSRRLALMSQFDEVVRRGDKEDRAEMRDRIRQFNREMRDLGVGTMGITSDQLRQSLLGRARGRVRHEAGLPAQRMQIPAQKKVMDLYPDEVKRVK